MSSEVLVRATGLSKCYTIYRRPEDRLKQMLWRGRRRFYEECWAVRDVDFAVRRGDVIGIIGRNGAGKSTVLQMVSGTIAPTHGTVETMGRVAALLELGAGFNPEFTGRENIFINGTILGLAPGDIESRLDDIIAFADIGPYIERPVKTYSSGMYMRLAFAVAAHVDADVLIIDEALAVGDAYFAQKCLRFLKSFAEHGAILFVSHNTNVVMGLCHTAIWLDQGGMRAHDTAKVVCELYLRDIYEHRQGDSDTAIATAPRTQAATPRVNDNRETPRHAAALAGFSFDPAAAGFGLGGARIEGITLTRADGGVLSHVEGGETVRLTVRARALQANPKPIIGFYIKDALGQRLVGDNTYEWCKDTPFPVAEGACWDAVFEFEMPVFMPGPYSIDAAVAEGTNEEHVIHHWVHDMLSFTVTTSTVRHSLVGIAFRAIRQEKA
jgi:homopolymeric O-antigen transport system ATP-binding protein